MKEIDWSKAPDGSTHYCPKQEAFYADMGEKWMIWSRNLSGLLCWQLSTGTVRDCLIPAPSGSVWTGEGLPPVGTVCEFKAGHSQFPELSWTEVRIVSHDRQGGRDFAVFASMSGYGGCCNPADFRPIRTPEQIATEEREKAIDEMAEHSPLLDKTWSKKVCAALYDAGYRKVTQ